KHICDAGHCTKRNPSAASAYRSGERRGHFTGQALEMASRAAPRPEREYVSVVDVPRLDCPATVIDLAPFMALISVASWAWFSIQPLSLSLNILTFLPSTSMVTLDPSLKA